MASKEPVAESTPVAHVEFVGKPPFGREFIGNRVITKEQFSRINILVDNDLEFNEGNGWRQQIDPRNEALVRYFDQTDVGFRVTGLAETV